MSPAKYDNIINQPVTLPFHQCKPGWELIVASTLILWTEWVCFVCCVEAHHKNVLITRLSNTNNRCVKRRLTLICPACMAHHKLLTLENYLAGFFFVFLSSEWSHSGAMSHCCDYILCGWSWSLCTIWMWCRL